MIINLLHVAVIRCHEASHGAVYSDLRDLYLSPLGDAYDLIDFKDASYVSGWPSIDLT